MKVLNFLTDTGQVFRSLHNKRDYLLKLIHKMGFKVIREIDEEDTAVDYSKGENPAKLIKPFWSNSDAAL